MIQPISEAVGRLSPGAATDTIAAAAGEVIGRMPTRSEGEAMRDRLHRAIDASFDQAADEQELRLRWAAPSTGKKRRAKA